MTQDIPPTHGAQKIATFAKLIGGILIATAANDCESRNRGKLLCHGQKLVNIAKPRTRFYTVWMKIATN